MRKLISILFVVAFIIAAALVAPTFMNWNSYKGKAQAQIKTMTGYDVALNGDVSMRILPYPALSVEDVVLQNAGDTLATFKKLQASVALWPLLSGAVQVDSVNLIEPHITLKAGADGQQNWMTPQLQEMMAKGKSAQGQDGQSKKAPAVSLQNVEIEQGSFSLTNTVQNVTTSIENVNLDVKAKDLKGPFNIDGSLRAFGQDVQLKIETGVIEQGASSVSLTAQATVKGTKINYKGVVGTAQPFSAQGELIAEAASLADTLKSFGVANPPVKGKMYMDGMLTASQEKIEYRDMRLDLGDMRFQGGAVAGLKPMNVQVDLKAQDAVNLDTLLPSNNAKQQSDFVHPGTFLPQKLNLAAGTNASVKIEAPKVIFKGQEYENAAFGIGVKDQVLSGALSVGSMPGQARAELSGKLSGATPQATFSVKASSGNLAQTMQALALAPVSGVSSASIDLNGKLTRDTLGIESGAVKLDDTNLKVAGSLQAQANGRPKLVVDVATDTLNLDKLLAAGGQQTEEKADVSAAIKAISLPFDLVFDAGAQTLITGGKTIRGLRAQGTLDQNAVNLSSLSVQDYAGVSANVQGKISDLQNLSGIDMAVIAEAKNVEATAKALGMDKSPLPAQVKSLKVDTKVSGTAAALQTVSNLGLLGGNVTARGEVRDILTAPVVGDLALQVNHKNMASFLREFSTNSPYYVSLEKPMSISANIQQQGKTYIVNDLKGDLAGTSMSGQLSANTGGDKPDVTGTLHFGDLDVQTAEWNTANCCGKDAPNTKAGKSSERWPKTPIDTGWMNAANLDFDIQANSLAYQSWNLQKPVLEFSIKDGVMMIEKMNAALYDGTANISGQIKSSAGPLSFNTKTTLSNINLEPLVGSMVGTKLIKGTGKVNLSADVSGTGRSMHDLVNSLSGSGQTTGQNIVLEGMDLTRFARALSGDVTSKDNLLNLWKGTTGGGSTQFDTLDGAFAISRGIVVINKLDLDGEKASLTTKGDVNLPDWRIRTAHTITLKHHPDVPPFTVNIDGPLDHPVQSMGKGAINDYISRKAGDKINKLIQDKVTDKIGGDLGGQVGNALGSILGVQPSPAPAPVPAPAPAANDNVAPAAEGTSSSGDAAAPQPAPVPATQERQSTPEEEAIRGLINGLLQ